MASRVFLLETMWSQNHNVCGLPQPNTHITFPFIQGSSRLQKKVTNLTFLLSDT